jgi:hypothetical protein
MVAVGLGLPGPPVSYDSKAPEPSSSALGSVVNSLDKEVMQRATITGLPIKQS